MCLFLVGNHTFAQKWTLVKNKEYKQNVPAPLESNAEQETLNEGKSGRYKNIDEYTTRAPTYLKKTIKTAINANRLML